MSKLASKYTPLAFVGVTVTVLWYLVKTRGNGGIPPTVKTIGEGSAGGPTTPPATRLQVPTKNFLLDLINVKKDTETGVCQWEKYVLSPSGLQYKFEDFVGQSELIHDTQRAVLLYLKKPLEFPDAPQILLYGPSGSGKTMLAMAIASELRLKCYKVDITTYNCPVNVVKVV